LSTHLDANLLDSIFRKAIEDSIAKINTGKSLNKLGFITNPEITSSPKLSFGLQDIGIHLGLKFDVIRDSIPFPDPNPKKPHKKKVKLDKPDKKHPLYNVKSLSVKLDGSITPMISDTLLIFAPTIANIQIDKIKKRGWLKIIPFKAIAALAINKKEEINAMLNNPGGRFRKSIKLQLKPGGDTLKIEDLIQEKKDSLEIIKKWSVRLDRNVVSAAAFLISERGIDLIADLELKEFADHIKRGDRDKSKKNIDHTINNIDYEKIGFNKTMLCVLNHEVGQQLLEMKTRTNSIKLLKPDDIPILYDTALLRRTNLPSLNGGIPETQGIECKRCKKKVFDNSVANHFKNYENLFLAAKKRNFDSIPSGRINTQWSKEFLTRTINNVLNSIDTEIKVAYKKDPPK
jgi:hypothetical protein